MTASAVVRVDVELTGLGKDKMMSHKATVSDVPTQMYGPLYSLPGATTVVQLDTISIVSGEMIGIGIRAVGGAVIANPVASLPMATCGLYLADGGPMNFYSYKTTTSAFCWIEPQTAGAAVEYILYSIT
jgi:hypothetical protein